jgi:hypothetical protein
MWSHVLTFRSKAIAWLTAGIGSLAALGVAFALGAFEAADKTELPQIAAGQSLDAGKWLIKPLRAWVTDQKIYGIMPKAGEKALVFEAEMLNRSVQSDNGYGNTFLLPPAIADKAETPMAYLERDASVLPDLQPGMAEKIIYIWRMPADSVPKDNLELNIEAWKFKLRNNLTGAPGWWSKAIAGTVRLPLSAGEG